jgi:catechol 2,3-dioxygenase-like lactoylglutathione lyase family enzyme
MVDRGLTHVALPVSNLNDSIACYTTYARMQVVHRRTVPATGFEVAWLSDNTRPFVVLSERSQVDHPLVPPAHLGVGKGGSSTGRETRVPPSGMWPPSATPTAIPWRYRLARKSG